VLSFFGLIHGEAIGFARSPVVAGSYLVVAIALFASAKFAVPVPRVEAAAGGHGY
jgi:AGZA family xanthine/uracil permease-like MFS transporter